MISALQAQELFRAHPAQQEYWAAQQQQWTEPLVVPRDHLRAAAAGPATVEQDLPAATPAAVTGLTGGDPLLLRVLASTALAVVAARATDRDDVVVFVPALPGRIGAGNRALPMGVDVASDAAAKQLLGAVRAAYLRMGDNLDVPVQALLDRAGVRPSDFMVSVDGDLDGADADRAGTPFLVELITGERARLSLRYDPKLFTEPTARRLLSVYQHVLHSIATAPATAVAELRGATEAELATLTGEFNDTAAEFPEHRLLHSFLEEQARVRGDQVAIVDDGTTYAQLNANANRLARTLRARGVTAGSIVGVCVPRSPMMLTAIYAVLKAGGAYLPIDPTLPRSRVDYLLEHSRTTLVLATAATLPVLGSQETLDLDDAASWHEADDDLPAVTGPQDACYVIYTSGSTGRPKGVVVEHRAIVNRLWWMQREHPLGPDDVILHKTPFTFDVSVWEIFWWSIAGARVATLPNGAEKDPEQLMAGVLAHGATTMHFVPTMLQAFLTYGEASGTTARLSSLRRVFASGEALAAGHAEAFRRVLPGTRLINLYGPTEAAVDVSHFDCEAVDSTRSVPIGKPIDNIRLYVRTRSGELAPIGVPGELCIAGVGLARGYLHAPELTEERFVTGSAAIGRVYRTGDLARWLPDGTIEYLGRLDTQVKIRGYRIELGEIEHVAAKAPGVVEIAVAAVAVDGEDKALCGYVVAGPDFDETALRAVLSAELPSYMVPQFLQLVPSIPTNHNGKRDLSSLPKPVRDGSAQDYAEPVTDMELLLAGIWSEVLGVTRIGARDSFFALGGDSILGIRVVAALRQAGYEATVGDVFAHQRLADLATVVRAVDGTHPAQPVVEASSWPASALQLGMIYHSSMETETPVYHDIFRYEFTVPRVDEGALVAAWEWLAKRHSVLRGRFDLDAAAGPLMVVVDAGPLPIDSVDLREEQNPGQVVAAWAEREKTTPIDPTAGLAYRVRLFVTAPDRVVVGLSFHHAILDGWSVASLVEEWGRVYGDLLDGGEPEPPQAAVPLQQLYATLEREAEADPEQTAFWRAELADCQVLEVPRLAGERREDTAAAQVLVRGKTLEPELLDTLRRRAVEWSVPLKSVFLAAHLRVLSMVANQRDVVTGLVTNGRPEVDGAEQALGMFLNTLPFRLNLAPDDSWRTLALRCFELELRLQPQRWYPLPAIQRLNGGTAAFEVLFNFTNFHVHQRQSAAERPGLIAGEYFEQTNAPLVVYVGSNPFDGGWEYRIGYDPSRFTADQVDRYLGYYLGCFEALAGEGDARWVDTVPLSAPEKAELLPPIARRDTPDLDGSRSLPARFAAMVGKHADRVAVSCDGRRLTYRELDRRSNALATHLADLGVRPGDLVGLALDRGLEMVLCILATIKAGGVYVPVDPGYPEERIRATVEDADVRLLIADPGTCSSFPDRATLACTAESFAAIIGDGADEGPVAELGPDAPAYVIYTSGSTGRPKGVQVTHGNVLRLFGQTDDWYGFSEQDTWSLFHSFAFDFSVWELWGALLYGGHLVVVPFWVSRSIEDFADLVVRERVTVLSQTPSAFGQLKQALMDRLAPGEGSLRHIVFGGEALDFASLADWFGHFGDARPRLVNMYGITETTVHVTYRRVLASDVSSPGSLIGEPIPDLGLYLIDEHANPVPLGTPGEIAVAGGGVAVGYLNRPEETAKRFVELDLGHGSTRVYRSGDLARRLPGGDVEYLGRGDAQVKVQGYRIEIGDIEFALSSHPAVASVLVVAFTRRSGAKALAGYYVPVAGDPVDQAVLRAHLAERLPAYMVPSFLIGVERWPLTINGKIDRKALPEPEQQLAPEREHTAPRTATEAHLARIWEEVLGVERVGIDDAYYELGGDSLQGIRLVGALRRGGFQVALQDLFRLQTIRELVDNGTTESTVDTEVASEPFSLVPEADRGRLPAGVLDAYPATQLQLGMIFHTDLEPAQATFHDLIRYQVELPFDAEKLTSLLAVMVERHEVLRTSFALGGYSRPLQLVHDHGSVNLAVHDLTHLSAAHQTAVLDDWFDDEKSTGFLWSSPTLMRFFVHRRNSGSFFLSVSFHHSIIDGWSFSGLMAGLLEDYRRAVSGQPATVPAPPPLAYRDYVRLELEAQQDKAGRDYWIEQLAGVPTTRLPRLPEADARWAEAELTLDEDQYTRLAAVAARYQAPVKHLCLAVHLRALALISREVDVTTGVFGHGRPEHPEADRMVGLFLNILPTRVTVPAGWDELIAEVTRLEHQHIPHRRFSYASIQQATGGERLAETAFNFVNFSAYADQLGTAGAGVIGGLKWFEHADFALLVTFNADIFANRLKVNFNAAAQVLGRDAVRVVASVYSAVLADLISDRTSETLTDPDPALLAELPMTAAGSVTPVPGPVPTGITELLAEICGVTPAELADVQPDSLTAVHIKYALHERFGLTVSLREILGADLTTLGR